MNREFRSTTSEVGQKRKSAAQQRQDEHLGGYDLWREISTVTTLLENKRATGPLREILSQIRDNTLKDANLLLLQSRVIGTQVVGNKVHPLPVGVRDERRNHAPFSNNTV